MPLSYILRRVSAEAGLGNLSTNATQRARAVDLINIAAEYVWEQTDLPGCCDEILIAVQSNNELALPPYIGELRAMREKSLMHKWTLNDMRPRYQKEPWKQLWRNWRHKGTRPLQLAITNTAPPLIIYPVASDLIITLNGATAESNNISEDIDCSNSTLASQGTQPFTRIDSISKTTPNDFDVTITDIDGNILAVLYSNELKTRYILVDVSQYPFGGDTNNNARTMEVLYKRRLTRLTRDSDEFPVDGWDNVIVDKALQLFYEAQQGKEQKAMFYAQKVQNHSHNKIRHQEGGIEKEMQFDENPFYDMTKRPYSRIWRG